MALGFHPPQCKITVQAQRHHAARDSLAASVVKIFGKANVFTEQAVNDDGSPRPAMSGELVPGDVVVRHPTLGWVYFDLVWKAAEGASAAQRNVSAAHLAHTEKRNAHENRTLGHPHLRQIRFVPIAISSFGEVAPPTVDELRNVLGCAGDAVTMQAIGDMVTAGLLRQAHGMDVVCEPLDAASVGVRGRV